MSVKLTKENDGNANVKQMLLAGGMCALVGVAMGFGITYGVMSSGATKNKAEAPVQTQTEVTSENEKAPEESPVETAEISTEESFEPVSYEGDFSEELKALGIEAIYEENLSNEDTKVYSYTGEYSENIVDTVSGLGETFTVFPDSVPVEKYEGNENTEVSNKDGIAYILKTDDTGNLEYCFESGIQGDASSGYSGYLYAYANGYENIRDAGFSYGGLNYESSLSDIIETFGMPMYLDVYVGEGEYIYLTYVTNDGSKGVSLGVFEDQGKNYLGTVNYWTALSEEEALAYIPEVEAEAEESDLEVTPSEAAPSEEEATEAEPDSTEAEE